MRTLVWFRGKDLRVADHAPLREAAASGDVLPLFVIDPYFFAPARAAELPHRIQFLLDSLEVQAQSLAARGSRLLLAEGKSVDVVPELARRWKADRVVAHRWVEPLGRERDRRVAAALGDAFALYDGATLLPPGTLRNQSGHSYAVFSHFARAFRKVASIPRPLSAPRQLPPIPADVHAPTRDLPTLQGLGLCRNDALQRGGEQEARQRLRRFLRIAELYPQRRNRMDLDGTSRLSADLKFGTLSIRSVWRAVESALEGRQAGHAYLSELLWREFSHSTLWDRPDVLSRPFRRSFEAFPWRDDTASFHAWVAGETGFPVVDASARQLLAEGFVHNRARMISASFLAKHLLVDYRWGEAHYMKYLTDGDWAQNNAGWQWSAGTGCDAQPYFRVFNPTLQGQRFDPEGRYVRHWLPELGALPTRYIHAPWLAPTSVLEQAGLKLGSDYPEPIVDHATARKRYLALASSVAKSTRG